MKAKGLSCDATMEEDPILIGNAKSVEEILDALARRGCSNLTPSIDLTTCSDFPCAGGGMCDVYRGVLDDGTGVAIKTLRIYGDNDRVKILKSAARELYHWSKLQHCNVLPLMGLTIFREHLSIVSEWMENGSLLSYLKHTPDANRLKLCMDICAGLSYIHTNDMVHGDLKAANIMVSSNGTALIADFGNAELRYLTLRFTNTSKLDLSVRWAAPELLAPQGSPRASKEADVYAFGMTVLEVMTGKVPFHGIMEYAIPCLVLVKGKVPPRPGTCIHDDLWDVLVWCWAREPTERPSIMRVKDRLQALFQSPFDTRSIGDTGLRPQGLGVSEDDKHNEEQFLLRRNVQEESDDEESSEAESDSDSQGSKSIASEHDSTRPNMTVGEESSQRSAQIPVSAQSPSARRSFSPPRRSATERIIVAVTHDAENYVVVDLTGYTDGQVIRERILSKLHIPAELHSSFSIYRTELGELDIGAALDNTQLLLACQHFGDDKGSLKFLAQSSDAPAEDEPDMPVPTPTIASVPHMLPSSRGPGSALPASDRLAKGYEAPVSAPNFELADEMQTRSPLETPETKMSYAIPTLPPHTAGPHWPSYHAESSAEDRSSGLSPERVPHPTYEIRNGRVYCTTPGCRCKGEYIRPFEWERVHGLQRGQSEGFPCWICGRVFSRADSRMRHMMTQHPEQ